MIPRTHSRSKPSRRKSKKVQPFNVFYPESTKEDLDRVNEYLNHVKNVLLSILHHYYPPLKTIVRHFDSRNPPMLVMEIETNVKRLANTIARTMFNYLPTIPGGPPPPTRSLLRIKKGKKPLYIYQACWL